MSGSVIPAQMVGAPRRKHSKKRLIIMGAVVLLVVSIPVVYFGKKFTTKKEVTQCNGKQDNQLYKDAATVIGPGGTKSLGRMVEKIKLEPRYEEDISCLYPITVYYLNTSDLDNSKKYLALYEQKVNKGKKLVNVFGDAKAKLVTLKSRVAVLEQSKADVDKRRQYSY